MKFKSVKAGEINPETTVIARTDGQSMKGNFYLVINLAKPHGSEVYEVLKRHGYNIPEVEDFLSKKVTERELEFMKLTWMKSKKTGNIYSTRFPKSFTDGFYIFNPVSKIWE